MIDTTLLETLSRIRVTDAAPALLRDILDVEIHGETAGQRLADYMAQVGNPYCFRVGGTPVKLSFNPRGDPLGKRLEAYFSGLRG